MKLLNLVLSTVVSVSALAHASPPDKLDYVKLKSVAISTAMMNKFDDPEEPSLTVVAAFVRESFLKDGYSISEDNAYLCISRELRGDDERYATSYEVLRDGHAVDCLSKNLTLAGSKKLETAKQISENVVRELQAKMTKPETLEPQEVAHYLRKAFSKEGYEISEDTATYCISFEMRKDDERYATAYEVVRDGYALPCFEKNLKSK